MANVEDKRNRFPDHVRVKLPSGKFGHVIRSAPGGRVVVQYEGTIGGFDYEVSIKPEELRLAWYPSDSVQIEERAA